MRNKENAAIKVLEELKSNSLNTFLKETGLSILGFLELINSFQINEDEKNELLLNWQQLKTNEKIRILVESISINEKFTSEKFAEILQLKKGTIEKKLKLLAAEGVVIKCKDKLSWKKINADLLHPQRRAGHENNPYQPGNIGALYARGSTGHSTSRGWHEHE
jgi:predicted HTH transcriptional regulator